MVLVEEGVRIKVDLLGWRLDVLVGATVAGRRAVRKAPGLCCPTGHWSVLPTGASSTGGVSLEFAAVEQFLSELCRHLIHLAFGKGGSFLPSRVELLAEFITELFFDTVAARAVHSRAGVRAPAGAFRERCREENSGVMEPTFSGQDRGDGLTCRCGEAPVSDGRSVGQGLEEITKCRGGILEAKMGEPSVGERV